VDTQHSLQNILLTISYDGTDFCGWQKQTKAGNETYRTVQGEIEAALQKLLKRKTELVGSGRTDSGVHAAGQIANFSSTIKNMEAENYIQALNSMLPKDVRIVNAEKVALNFNARFSSKSRTYRYFCNTQEFTLAHLTRYTWNIRYMPHLLTLNKMAQILQGEIDFTTFAASGDMSLRKSRYVEKAFFFMQNEMLIFEITANAFLWRMVRSLVGTMIELEKKGGTEHEFAEILHACDRKKAGFTAPAQGLFLWKVSY
jgi:tRNA pseudouridine synthase A